MTGYGRGEISAGGLSAVVECASVNRKVAEVVWSAPRELAVMEPLVREDVLRRVARGRVTVTAEVVMAPDARLVDRARARTYLAELRGLARDLGLAAEPALETVLAGPGVVRLAAPSTSAWPVVRRALGVALDAMAAARALEGAHLGRALAREAGSLAKLAVRARVHAARVPGRVHAAMHKRVRNAGVEVEPARLAAEILLLATRSDVTEELDRIEGHGEQFAEKLALGSRQPVGRPLEFLAQEMSREWNTLGSKAADPAIARLVVEAKSCIDRIREQLANLE